MCIVSYFFILKIVPRYSYKLLANAIQIDCSIYEGAWCRSAKSGAQSVGRKVWGRKRLERKVWGANYWGAKCRGAKSGAQNPGLQSAGGTKRGGAEWV